MLGSDFLTLGGEKMCGIGDPQDLLVNGFLLILTRVPLKKQTACFIWGSNQLSETCCGDGFSWWMLLGKVEV